MHALYKFGKLSGDFAKYRSHRNKVVSVFHKARKSFLNLSTKRPKAFGKPSRQWTERVPQFLCSFQACLFLYFWLTVSFRKMVETPLIQWGIVCKHADRIHCLRIVFATDSFLNGTLSSGCGWGIRFTWHPHLLKNDKCRCAILPKETESEIGSLTWMESYMVFSNRNTIANFWQMCCRFICERLWWCRHLAMNLWSLQFFFLSSLSEAASLLVSIFLINSVIQINGESWM